MLASSGDGNVGLFFVFKALLKAQKFRRFETQKKTTNLDFLLAFFFPFFLRLLTAL